MICEFVPHAALKVISFSLTYLFFIKHKEKKYGNKNSKQNTAKNDVMPESHETIN